MRSSDVTDAIILDRLNIAAREAGVSLTYGHKLFFLRLLNLCVLEGVDSDAGYDIDKTTAQLSAALNMSPRMVTQCLNKLSACGAVHRRAGATTFPRSPHITTIDPKFYQ